MVLVAVIAGGVLLTTFSGDPTSGAGGEQKRPTTSPASRDAGDEGLSESQRALAATRTLIDLEQGVRTEQEQVFDRAFAVDPESTQARDDIFTSLTRLPLSTYSMRYIGEVSHREGTWVADVAVQWGLSGVDRRAVTNEIEVTFTDEGPGDGARVVSMEAGSQEQAPVWLLGRLEAQQVGPAMVLSLQAPLTEGVADQTRRAVRDVRRVLTGWDGGLVVVLPETTAQLEELLRAVQGIAQAARFFVRRGYAFVAQDVRGRGDSGGRFHHLLNTPDEGVDGYDTLAWIRAQPWCDGRIGTQGGSFTAANQQALALHRPPGLAAQVLRDCGTNYYRRMFRFYVTGLSQEASPFDVAAVVHHAYTTSEPKLRYVCSWGAAESIAAFTKRPQGAPHVAG